MRMILNPFMPNGLSHLYQLDEFISNLRLLGGIFIFIHFQIEYSARQK